MQNSAFAVRRHIRMDPGGALFGVDIDDRTAKVCAYVVLRDGEAVGKLSFDQVAGHPGDLQCWLGVKGVENRAARDACPHRENYPICTEAIPILGLNALSFSALGCRTRAWIRAVLGAPQALFEWPLYGSGLKHRSACPG